MIRSLVLASALLAFGAQAADRPELVVAVCGKPHPALFTALVKQAAESGFAPSGKAKTPPRRCQLLAASTKRWAPTLVATSSGRGVYSVRLADLSGEGLEALTVKPARGAPLSGAAARRLSLALRELREGMAPRASAVASSAVASSMEPSSSREPDPSCERARSASPSSNEPAPSSEPARSASPSSGTVQPARSSQSGAGPSVAGGSAPLATAPLARTEPVAQLSPQVRPLGAPSPGPRGDVALEVGLGSLSRRFTYRDDLFGVLNGFQLPLAPTVDATLAWDVASSGWRLVGAGRFLLPTSTLDLAGAEHPTRAFDYRIGVQRGLEAGPLRWAATLSHCGQAFEVTPGVTLGARLPAVGYFGAAANLEVAIPLGDALALELGGGYRHLFTTGELGSIDYFPRIRAAAAEGRIALDARLFGPVTAQAAAEYRRYFASMNVQPGDPLVAGGALDEYLGLSFAVGVRL